MLKNIKSILGNQKIQAINVRKFSNKIKLNSSDSIRFPLKFEGATPGKNSDKSRLYETALQEIYEIDIKSGFKLAYQSTMEAFVQNDVEFFKDICEPRLFTEIEDGCNRLKDLGYTISADNLQTDDIDITVDSFTMIYGVFHNRAKNGSKSEYMSRDINFNGIDMKFNQPLSFNPMMLKELYPFLQVGCTFQSPINIVVKNSKGDVVAGLNSSKKHRILFESVQENSKVDAANHIAGLAQQMSGLMGAMKMMGNQEAMKGFIKKLFFSDDLVWKISDIDDHLNGNPFIS